MMPGCAIGQVDQRQRPSVVGVGVLRFLFSFFFLVGRPILRDDVHPSCTSGTRLEGDSGSPGVPICELAGAEGRYVCRCALLA